MSRFETTTSFETIEHNDVGGKIAGGPDEVLPRLPVSALADAIRRLPPDELEFALRNKIMPIVCIPGLFLCAACGPAARTIARNAGLKLVAESGVGEFLAAARQIHGRMLLHDATFALADQQPRNSALRRFTPAQIVALLVVAGAVAAACIFMPARLAWLIASLVAGLFFLAVIALRILCLMPPLRTRKTTAASLADSQLPTYSVLVPLFRETSVLNQLLTALTRLNYPALCSKRTKIFPS